MMGGIGILLGGNWRMKRSSAQGAVLMGLGSAVFLLTVFAAREVYGFFTPASALGMMGLIAFFTGVASWKHNELSLGVIGLVAGGVAPLLTASANPDLFGLFSYLFIIVTGTIWLATIKGWRTLIFLSWALAFLYSVPYFVMSVPSGDVMIASLFAILFGALFYGVGLSTIAFQKRMSVADIVTAVANAGFVLLWINTLTPDHLKSSLTALVAVIFALGAFILFRVTELRGLFYTYAGVAFGMFVAATTFELSGSALIIAYTIEAVVLSLMTAQVIRNPRLGAKLGLLLSVPAVLSIENMDSYAWRDGIFHDDFFVLFTVAASFLGLGRMFGRLWRAIEPVASRLLVRVFYTFGSIYWFILLYLVIDAAILNETTARMVTLIVYTLFGIVCYLIGMQREQRGVRLTGEILFGVVVLDLLFVEVWNMTITGKVITFLLVGALLISTIFVRKDKKEEITTDHEA
jgi:uncharacterized membrane protein